MANNIKTEAVKNYYKDVCKAYRLGNVESSYNEPIMSLFNALGCACKDLSGERKGDAGENIDIKLWHSEEEVTETEPFAGIEVKKVNGIDERARRQIIIEAERYGNAILTDNKEWRFWRAGEAEMYTGFKIMESVDNELILIEENIELFISLVEDFMLSNPTQIKSSTKLAEYMAFHAKTIRSIVAGILKDDGNGQPLINDAQRRLPIFLELCGLYNKIKSELRPLINTREFADMYAQTIVYGLFIARYNDTTLDTFDKYEAIQYLQEESELLKQFFVHIAGAGTHHPTLEGVIDKLCSLYRICDISALLDNDENKDTIIHFYEEFLAFYDPELRKSLGVFYTPVQAVQFLISMVDKALIEDLKIDGGLSNNESFSIKVPILPYRASKRSKKLIDSKEISVPRVAILDPACGTGSFGAEIIKYVKNTYFSGAKEAFYENYILNEDGLLSRLIGFEIMMTSYVVAHLKMRRTINETLGYIPTKQVSTKIYLTNTLAKPKSDKERTELMTLFDFSAAITDEAYYADTWKIRRPIKIVIGNPPYLAASTNPYDISAYKTETDGVTPFGEQKHWLNNDYVKFFRFAEQIINKYSEGILAYVSSNSFLDEPTFRGMRGSLLRTFDKIYIVNLHGKVNENKPKDIKDENIFEIREGISLFIGIKTTKRLDWAKVYYSEMWGTKKEKLDTLSHGDLAFVQLKIDQKMAYFIPFGDDDKEPYEKGVSIANLFPTNVTGIVSGNDSVSIAPSRTELINRMDIAKNAKDEKDILNLWGKFSRGQTAEKIQNDVLSDGVVTPISFRPFDSRWTYYSGNSCGWVLWPREKSTMGHLLTEPTSPVGANIGLVFCKTSRTFFSPFVSNHIIAHRLFSAKCEITYIAPLYLHSKDELTGESWSANINENEYNKLTQYLEDKPSPIDIFDYVYGILHDPVYCVKFGEYLCRDFPRVPIINEPEEERNENSFFVSEELFSEYVSVGEKLRKLHLMETKKSAELTFEPSMPDDMTIGGVKYKKELLYINESTCIAGITKDVWEYNIGGYQVLSKWFKEHKGEKLSIDSFSHIENVVGLLSETIKLQEYLRGLH